MWKEILRRLELTEQWDTAIEFMIPIVEQEQSLDAYLAIEYLLMNLLVEEQYDESKHDYYAALALKYFNESYSIFKDNPEYLYYMGRIAVMSEWYFNIEIEDAEHMIHQAIALDPYNKIYAWYTYAHGNLDSAQIMTYAQSIIDDSTSIKKILLEKGSLGEYILGMMTHWSKCILGIL